MTLPAMNRIISSFAFLAFTACGPEDPPGQRPGDSAEALGGVECLPTSQTCAVEARHLSRLGSFDGEQALEAGPNSISLDGLGRVWLTVGAPTMPYVFDTLGDLIMRPGRAGQGPGEFEWPSTPVPMEGDSVAVFDSEVGRATVLDAGGEYARSWPLSYSASSPVRVFGDTFAVGYGGCRRNKEVVQIVQGPRVIASFDDHGPRDRWSDCMRVLALGRQGSVWSADRHEYVIRRFDTAGNLLDSIKHRPEWWAERSSYDWQIRESPGPFIQAVREDDLGRLWVVIWRDSEEWLDAWRRFGQDRIVGGEIRGQDRPATIDLFSTVVQVWDIESSRLLVSKRWPGLVLALLGEHLWAALTEDIYGVPYVDLWQIRLSGN